VVCAAGRTSVGLILLFAGRYHFSEWRMPSATEPIGPGKSANVPRFWAGFARWNRKLHFYAGLFLLFFLWLFALSGLLLNHPSWSFAESWNNRKETNYDREITALGPEVKGDLGQAREIARQLGIEGEILLTTTRTDAGPFDFQVRRPAISFSSKPIWRGNALPCGKLMSTCGE